MLYSSGNPASPLNAYDDTKGFMLDLFGKSYKLFSVATNGTVEYRAETDTEFLRCFFDTTNNKWMVYDKSGTAYYFGETSSTRRENQNRLDQWCNEHLPLGAGPDRDGHRRLDDDCLCQ